MMIKKRLPRSLPRRTLQPTLLAAVMVWVTGCGALLTGGPAPSLYTLTPKSTFSAALPDVAWQLVIEEPRAGGGLDTNRVALHPAPTEVKYFAKSRWTERAPRMVQTLLVESFENTGRIVAVGRQAVGLRSDYNLSTELREFQAQYYPDAGLPTIRVKINVKIIQQPQQAIIASQSFEATRRSEAGGIESIISAFDYALGEVLKGIVEWTLTTTADFEAIETQ